MIRGCLLINKKRKQEGAIRIPREQGESWESLSNVFPKDLNHSSYCPRPSSSRSPDRILLLEISGSLFIPSSSSHQIGIREGQSSYGKGINSKDGGIPQRPEKAED